MQFVQQHIYGVFGSNLWICVSFTAVWLHITTLGNTLFLHRDQTHRSISLHPALRHFFRFWLWLSTGVRPMEWVAVHRKHHANADSIGDPHSPGIFGLRTVLLECPELYRKEARNPLTIERYGKGTADDWIERNLYSRFPNTGLGLLLTVDLLLFGIVGITIWALQLGTMLLLASIVGGLCHSIGYRNFATDDASTNLWQAGLFVGGEELHNNHHAFPTSAKFSMAPGELDIGWCYIRLLAALSLATLRQPPNPVQPPRGQPVSNIGDSPSMP